MYQKAIDNYLRSRKFPRIDLKAVLFDMDGVLFDSMGYHADAWHKTMQKHGLTFGPEEAYLHEGRTGASTINLIFRRELGRDATEGEIKSIYHEKTEAFNRFPETAPMPGAREVLEKVNASGLIPVVVTGSGQNSLLERLEKYFPGTFNPALMVTAFDVKYGKPHPEPYLMALDKCGLRPNEAIVVENAPLGVQAGVAAHLFTIAVNTGPLDDAILCGAGADLLFPSLRALSESWDSLLNDMAATGAKTLPLGGGKR